MSNLKGRFSFYILFCIWLFGAQPLLAGDIATINIPLQSYDIANKKYIEIDVEHASSQYQVHFIVERNKHAKMLLELELDGDGAVFFDHKLAFQKAQVSKDIFVHSISIDSLFAVNKSKKILITLAGFNEIRRAVLVSTEDLLPNSGLADIVNPQMREIVDSAGLLQLALIIFVLLIVLLKIIFRKSFIGIFDLAAIFRLKPREGVFYDMRILDPSNLLFNFIYGYLVSFVILSIFWRFNHLEIQSLQLSLVIMAILGTAFAAVIYLPVNFAIISLISSLFDISSFAKIHYYDRLRLGFFFTLIVLGLLYTDALFDYFEMRFNQIALIVLIFMSLRPIVLYLKLLRVANMSGIYLFSYLCTIELLPLFLVFKIITSAI